MRITHARPPLSEFINILVGFVVMLSISPIVAGFVAMHLLGAKSLVFRSLAEQVRLLRALTYRSRHRRGLMMVWVRPPFAQSVERKMQIQAAVREEVRRQADALAMRVRGSQIPGHYRTAAHAQGRDEQDAGQALRDARRSGPDGQSEQEDQPEQEVFRGGHAADSTWERGLGVMTHNRGTRSRGHRDLWVVELQGSCKRRGGSATLRRRHEGKGERSDILARARALLPPASRGGISNARSLGHNGCSLGDERAAKRQINAVPHKAKLPGSPDAAAGLRALPRVPALLAANAERGSRIFQLMRSTSDTFVRADAHGAEDLAHGRDKRADQLGAT